MHTFDIPAAYDYYDRHINRTERFDAGILSPCGVFILRISRWN